jgi:hypothetical protein
VENIHLEALIEQGLAYQRGGFALILDDQNMHRVTLGHLLQ